MSTWKRSRGDTIVEVLLAMSIIGLVLGAAFGIANRSVSIGQDAQDRTEALKINETQLELFRSSYKDTSAVNTRTNTQPFCFDTSIIAITVEDASSDKCTAVNGNGQKGYYSISITPPDPVVTNSRSYVFMVTWQRQGSSDNSNSTIYYEPGEL